MKIYHLGELVTNCPKVNYKLNYKPGYLICPMSKEMVLYDQVKDRVKQFNRMPWKYKLENYRWLPLTGDIEPNKDM